MAKVEAYEELYTKLDTREGAKIIHKLAKRSKDISDIAYVKDEDGTILTENQREMEKKIINSSLQKTRENN